MFLAQIWKILEFFYLNFFQFLEVKFSIYTQRQLKVYSFEFWIPARLVLFSLKCFHVHFCQTSVSENHKGNYFAVINYDYEPSIKNSISSVILLFINVLHKCLWPQRYCIPNSHQITSSWIWISSRLKLFPFEWNIRNLERVDGGGGRGYGDKGEGTG